ncbi:hypothetical protein NUU61_002339 [Penicillium alfredii]|uniref:6-methylsalicylate decarboxylase n=1 Tax=Penicillium alfredii TaxID=1506179 RepID=A0A9W9FS37_9EURO|nr:uncharacterized protein NUU61_002339 [Penicillium alfredii]KAJ5104992.1 hypothetical protein NUU61_002339 [Penicillium alfredii]
MAQPPPAGWLDIHGHFQPPMSSEEAQNSLKVFSRAKFILNEPAAWSAEEVLRYNDTANVRMQMLSFLPTTHDRLKRANDFGAAIVEKYPARFGLLAALPTDNPAACVAEIRRVTSTFRTPPDGFATTTVYNGVSLADPKLEPVWTELNARRAVVHIHPNAIAPSATELPTPLVEVAFDTTRTVISMLYSGVFRKFPNIQFVVGHCGAALPALSGRVELLGTEKWVANPNHITREEIKTQLGRLYVDTAATAKSGLVPAVQMCGVGRCVYGADCGVSCSTEATMEENRHDVQVFEREMSIPVNTIGENGWKLFPAAAKRAGSSYDT